MLGFIRAKRGFNPTYTGRGRKLAKRHFPGACDVTANDVGWAERLLAKPNGKMVSGTFSRDRLRAIANLSAKMFPTPFRGSSRGTSE
jgi:hypothetical protein